VRIGIQPFYGEFLMHPVPLEMDLGRCTSGCAFCFATLGNPDREADPAGILRLLATYGERRSPEAILLREGYPVLVSNRTDPFATGNERLLPILETATEIGIPLAFQTRGGRRLSFCLSFLRPAVWYLSFSQLDDAKRKTIEPGAPSVGSRLDTIRELREKGHRVVVALNPLVPEWLPLDDAETLIATLKDIGVEGTSVELLHLSSEQRSNMSEREKAAVSLPVLGRTKTRLPHPDDVAHLHAVRRLVTEAGIALFTSNQPTASEYWRPYRETYPRLLPSVQDAVDFCHANLEDGAILSFDDFLEALTWRHPLPPLTAKIDSYVRAKSRGGQLLADLLASGLVRAGMTWEEAIRVFYAEPRLRTSPSRWLCFAYAAERSSEGWIRLVDEEGLPYLVFTKAEGGTTEYHVEIGRAA
jgi:DNA repair photolyase